MSARLLVAALLLTAACSSNPDPPPLSCPIGDMSKDIELEIIHRKVGGGVATTMADGEVPLILPPQGGKVMLVGVRARNVDGCPLTVTSSLRDQCTGELIALEKRPVLLELVNGWGEPQQPNELNNYSNLPACPRQGLRRQVNDEPYELELIVEDKTGRKASKKLMIVPTCAEPVNEMQCRCECTTDYATAPSCDLTRDAGVVECSPDAG